MFSYFFELLRWVTYLYTRVTRLWAKTLFVEDGIPTQPSRIYFLSDTDEYDDSYETVPEDTVYVEEWMYNGEKKYVVRYEGDDIPKTWTDSPFMKEARCPWIWVGDKTTEIDLTKTFGKFLVPGNRITMDLVQRLIQVTDATQLMYIDAKTFNEEKFPGDGILIESNGPTL